MQAAPKKSAGFAGVSVSRRARRCYLAPKRRRRFLWTNLTRENIKDFITSFANGFGLIQPQVKKAPEKRAAQFSAQITADDRQLEMKPDSLSSRLVSHASFSVNLGSFCFSDNLRTARRSQPQMTISKGLPRAYRSAQ